MTMLSGDSEAMIDMKDVESVEVLIIGDKLWINVDGKCRLRIYHAKEIEVVQNENNL